MIKNLSLAALCLFGLYLIIIYFMWLSTQTAVGLFLAGFFVLTMFASVPVALLLTCYAMDRIKDAFFGD